MMKIDYNVNNKTLAALFVAADSCLMSFARAKVRNPIEFQRYQLNYQGLHPEKRLRLTDKFTEALDQAAGIPVEEWGSLHAEIHLRNEMVQVNAGVFCVDVTYDSRKKAYNVVYRELPERKLHRAQPHRKAAAA